MGETVLSVKIGMSSVTLGFDFLELVSFSLKVG